MRIGKPRIGDRIKLKNNLPPQVLVVGLIEIPMKAKSKVISATQFKVRVQIRGVFNEQIPQGFTAVKAAIVEALGKCETPIQLKFDDKLTEKGIFTDSQKMAIKNLVEIHNSKL